MILLRAGRWTTLAGLAMLAGLYVRALAFTPVERFQGAAQKIYYIHVPAAWTAMLAMAFVGGAGILYLLLRDRRFDRFAEASAEVGTAFSVVMLTTGPIWAKPIWGTWWTWDARLTFTLLLFLLFLGYLTLRGAVTEPDLRARYSAVLGICGLVLLPFIHLSVYLFRTLHPRPIVLQPARPALPPEMLLTLLLGAATMLVLYAGFVMQRMALAHRREREGHAHA
jgi:heme exporter protein C